MDQLHILITGSTPTGSKTPTQEWFGSSCDLADTLDKYLEENPMACHVNVDMAIPYKGMRKSKLFSGRISVLLEERV